MFVFKAAVVGAGTMGAEIAYSIATAGIPVVLKDVDQRNLDAGLARARSIWDGRVRAGRLESEQMERELALIQPALDHHSFGDVDFVIEAVPESLDLKRAVFAELDAVTPGHAILASNTSALSITEIGDATGRPDQVVGFHCFYPASVTRVIEVVEGEYSSPDTVQAATAFATQLKKTAIRCADLPGFVVNRILCAGLSEAFRFQVEQRVPYTAVDTALTEAGAAPIGPFALSDLLGLDTVLAVSDFIEESYGGRFFVHPQLRELVAAGDLGSKTGKGFYEHA